MLRLTLNIVLVCISVHITLFTAACNTKIHHILAETNFRCPYWLCVLLCSLWVQSAGLLLWSNAHTALRKTHVSVRWNQTITIYSMVQYRVDFSSRIYMPQKCLISASQFFFYSIDSFQTYSLVCSGISSSKHSIQFEILYPSCR